MMVLFDMLSRHMRLENGLFFLASKVGLIKVELPQPVEVWKGSFLASLLLFLTDGLEVLSSLFEQSSEGKLQTMTLQVLQRLFEPILQ